MRAAWGSSLPQHRESHLTFSFDEGGFSQDFSRLPGRHPHIAMVPQWDLLDLLAAAGRESPHFHLAQNAEVTDLLPDGGVRYLDRDTGAEHRLPATLVVAADGRHSTVREKVGLRPRSSGTPHDCLYLRIPRLPCDPEHTTLRFSGAGGLIMINRGDYWQTALLIGKDQADAARADDGARVRAVVSRLAPAMTERVQRIGADEIASLQVRIDRLGRWRAPGVLLIGDAAHAMSPIAGVRINLAVQDAVAAARVLVPALRRGTVTDRDLARVQRRRLPVTLAYQAFQKAAQKRFVAASMTGDGGPPPVLRMPLPLRVLRHVPGFPRVVGYLVGIGLRPEHLTGSLAPLRHDPPAGRDGTRRGRT